VVDNWLYKAIYTDIITFLLDGLWVGLVTCASVNFYKPSCKVSTFLENEDILPCFSLE
jgi:hypothetical protein